MATKSAVARNDLSRAFLFRQGVVGQCRPDPYYFPCLSVDSLAQDFGETTKIECPDPYAYGKFIEVDTVPGEVGRLTTTLTTHMDLMNKSIFRDLAVGGCGLDLHLHFGKCVDPTLFNTWDKAFVFEDVFITAYNTDPLGALVSGDRAVINETLDISVGNFYELVHLTYVERGIVQTALTTPFIDSEMFDIKNCGDCGISDGCSYMFAISGAGDFLISKDGSITWTESANTWGTTPVGISVNNGYAWAYDSTVPQMVFATKRMLDEDTAPFVYTANAIAGGVDQDSGKDFGLVVGTAGMIGRVTDPSCGFSEDWTGDITTENLSVVNFNETQDIALIGGANATIIYTTDGYTFEIVPPPADAAGLLVTAVYPVTNQHFLVAFGNRLYCTNDFGYSWSRIQCDGYVYPGTIRDIAQSTRHVFWMAIDNTLYRSIDGGGTWTLEPDGKKVFPVNTRLNSLLPCVGDANKVFGFGADGGSGFIFNGYA